MKILMVVMVWLTGVLFGFALAAWMLYDPVPIGPAKYALTRSAGPVPAHTMDGTQKLFRIECISESEKDCQQAAATPIPEPGTIGLMGGGLLILLISRRSTHGNLG